MREAWMGLWDLEEQDGVIHFGCLFHFVLVFGCWDGCVALWFSCPSVLCCGLLFVHFGAQSLCGGVLSFFFYFLYIRVLLLSSFTATYRGSLSLYFLYVTCSSQHNLRPLDLDDLLFTSAYISSIQPTISQSSLLPSSQLTLSPFESTYPIVHSNGASSQGDTRVQR